MPGSIGISTLFGWGFIAAIAYILGEYTSVFARMGYGVRLAGGGLKWFKGGPARQATLGLGGFFGGLYAGGFIWAAAGSVVAGGTAAGGAALLGLSPKQVIVAFLAALVVGLALYTGAAAEEAVDDAD